MPASKRLSVARCLADLGLLRALIAVRTARGYDVSRIRRLGDAVDLEPEGRFESDDVPVIGRVGVPDPQLGVEWQGHMPFYGKWFDEIGETDAGYHLRRGISSISEERLLEQIRRDDQYALVGDFASVFRTILEVKRRVPLVLIDDTFLELTSFPVILPAIADQALTDKLTTVLTIMLKAASRPAGGADDGGMSGIVVDEIENLQ